MYIPTVSLIEYLAECVRYDGSPDVTSHMYNIPTVSLIEYLAECVGYDGSPGVTSHMYIPTVSLLQSVWLTWCNISHVCDKASEKVA